MIRDVDDSNLEPTRDFLEAHVETSLFLLGNLTAHGARLGAHLNSGNYRLVEQGGAIVAVFCLTRRGNLLLQTGGRADLGAAIVEACAPDRNPIRGVIGEWNAAQSVWQVLCADPGFQPGPAQREVLYRRDLPCEADSSATLAVRALQIEDFDAWSVLNAAYCAEVMLPVHGTRAQRRAMFEDQARSGYWWGHFDGDEMIGTAALNAVYASLGQVGGVYTRPGYRGRGLARITLLKLMREAFERHHLDRLLLFTGEDNLAARRVYESLHFQARGCFALLFAAPQPQA